MADTLDRLSEVDADRRRVLIQGGVVLTLDPGVGDFVRGDILLEGRKIAAVASDLSEASEQSIVVDASGMIVMPGFHDTHRHSWQSQFRRALPDAELADYGELLLRTLSEHYGPDDMYAGTFLGSLGALDAGITTLLDFCHNPRTPAHTDAALAALAATGIRAVHTVGPPLIGEWDRQWPDDLVRVQREHCSSADQLITLRLGLGAIDSFGPFTLPTPERLAFARDLGIEISVDAVFGPTASRIVENLGHNGLLGPDITLIHCNDISADAWAAIADAGATVSLAPTSDAQLAIGAAIPPTQEALDAGIRPALSVDVECSLTTDMFTQMRVVLNAQRMLAFARRNAGDPDAPAPLTSRDLLQFATVEGARANGLLAKSGTLTPGKEADIVLISAEAINTLPLNNAVGTVVSGADTRNVDTVFVAGEPRKWRGSLVGVDVPEIKGLVEASRDRLLDAAGMTIDVLDAHGPHARHRSAATGAQTTRSEHAS